LINNCGGGGGGSYSITVAGTIPITSTITGTITSDGGGDGRCGSDLVNNCGGGGDSYSITVASAISRAVAVTGTIASDSSGGDCGCGDDLVDDGGNLCSWLWWVNDGSFVGDVFCPLNDPLNRCGLDDSLSGNLWHVVPNMLNGVVFSRQDLSWNGFHVAALLELGDGALPGHHFGVLTDLIVHDWPLVRDVLKA